MPTLRACTNTASTEVPPSYENFTEDKVTSPLLSKAESKESSDKIRSTDTSSIFEGIASLVLYALSSGSIWLFPIFWARHPGSVFLIQFLIMFFLASLPMFYLEVIIGQFASMTPGALYKKFLPSLGGFPATMAFVLFIRIICGASHTAHELAVSAVSISGLNSPADYSECDPQIDLPCFKHGLDAVSCFVARANMSDDCLDYTQMLLKTRGRSLKNTPYQVFARHMIQQEPYGIDFPSGYVLGCHVVTWLAIAVFSVIGWKTVTRIGTVAFVPCSIGLIVMLIKGELLPQANLLFNGSMLFKFDIDDVRMYSWSDAALMAVMALNIGSGGVSFFASHRAFHESLGRTVLAASAIILLVHTAAATVFFTFVAFIGSTLNPLEAPSVWLRDYANSSLIAAGPIPEYFSRQRNGWISIMAFFLGESVLNIVGLSLQMSVFTSIVEFSPLLRRFMQKRAWLVTRCGFILFCTLISALFLLPGGPMFAGVLQQLMFYPCMMISIGNSLAFCFVYGVKRLLVNIKAMTNPVLREFYYLLACLWALVSPILFLIAFVTGIASRHSRFPHWTVVGFVVVFVALLFIPVYLVRKIITTHRAELPVKMLLEPTKDWRPRIEKDHEENLLLEREFRIKR